MTIRRHRDAALLLTLGMLDVACAFWIMGCAMQDVPNPEYESWSRFRPGSFVALKTETRQGDSVVTLEQVLTLKSLEASKAVIGVKARRTAGGKSEDVAHDYEIPARVAHARAPAGHPSVSVREGEDDLDVAGRKVRCRWRRTSAVQENPHMRSTWTTWTSDGIPGGLARQEAETSGDEGSSRTVTVVTTWESRPE